MNWKKISTQEELDEVLAQRPDEEQEFCVILAGGLCRSSKGICRNSDGDYEVYNYIDDSQEVVKHGELKKHFIGEAMEKNAFYKY